MSRLNLAQALALAKASGVDRLDAQLLLARALSCSRTWLLAHDEALLDETQARQFDHDLQRRRDGVPLAYLLGEKEFHGLSLCVGPAVLVPRPETEVLVGWAIELLGGPMSTSGAATLADLGTGCGAIALAIKQAHPAARVCATDDSPAALAMAAANAARLGLHVEFKAGSWWHAVDSRRFHLAVSNPPYIAERDAHLQALVHEPAMALVSGADGLDALKTIIFGSHQHLLPGGWLLLEHGHDQGPAVHELLRIAGFAGISTRPDLAGLPRCTGAHR